MGDEFENESAAEQPYEAEEAASVEDAPSSSESSSEGEYSVADALAEARAELEGTESREAAEPDSNASRPTPDPAVSDPRREAWRALYGDDEEFPEDEDFAMAVRSRERTRIEARQSEDAAFRQLFLDHEVMRLEDPETFSERVLERPELAAFMAEYRRDHPNVSVDDPYPANTRPESVIRAELGAQVVKDISAVFEAAAKDVGIEFTPNQSAPGRIAWDFAKAYAEKIAADKLAAELPRIRAEEKKAAGLEAAKNYVGRMPVLHANGSHAGDRKSSPPSGRYSVQDALAETKEALGVN